MSIDVSAEPYRKLQPVFGQGDETRGYPLLRFLQAAGVMFQDIQDVVDPGDGRPSWSAILDIDAVPREWLPWLAQFVGVEVSTDAIEAAQRDEVRNMDRTKRGTPAITIALIVALLTGTQWYLYNERNGSAYRLGVLTRDDETPDPDAVLAAILSQKPGGIVLDYLAAAGPSYHAVRIRHDSYADVLAEYTDYDDMRTRDPWT